MKKQLLFRLQFRFVLFGSCKNLSDLDPNLFNCTPNPLETKAGKVATVTGTFLKSILRRMLLLPLPLFLKCRNLWSKRISKCFPRRESSRKWSNDCLQSRRKLFSRCIFWLCTRITVSELYLNSMVDKKKVYDLKPVKVADGVNASSELAQKSFEMS